MLATRPDAEVLAVALADAAPRIAALVGKTIVVKIGGSTLGSHDTTLGDLATLRQLGLRVVVVHGGGALITDWLKKIGKEAVFVRGLRVTDAETMDVATMALAGKVNKDLVGQLQARGVAAIGLSGVDGGLLRARQKDPELGAVGEVVSVETRYVRLILEVGAIPVIAPIALAADGSALNLNADTAAGEIAVALGAERLIFLTDVAGIKRDGEVLRSMTSVEARELIGSGVIGGGMIPKAEACLHVAANGGRSFITDGRVGGAILRQLFADGTVGTTITDETQLDETNSASDAPGGSDV